MTPYQNSTPFSLENCKQYSTLNDCQQKYQLANNLDNIDKIQRMWRAQWPEFSWLTMPGDTDSRCYQMFAPDISRVGYGQADPNGNSTVWSIMCPQQGVWIPILEGTLNIEVTVTSSGGIVNEDKMCIDAQMTIQPKIWFSPDTIQNNSFIGRLKELFEDFGIPFPHNKATAIKLNAYCVDADNNPGNTEFLSIKSGIDPHYPVPSFAQHSSYDIYGQIARSVAYVAVAIGDLVSSDSIVGDMFNRLVIDLFNVASGNLLQNGNILSWNVWVIASEAVCIKEWQRHADFWRFSLDVNHRSPEGRGRDPQYFDGSPFSPTNDLISDVLSNVKHFLESNLMLPSELRHHFDSFSNRKGEGKSTFL